MEGATSGEVAALRAGNVNLALHAVIARHVTSDERVDVIRLVNAFGVRATEMEALFTAVGWKALSDLGPEHRPQRLQLLEWACETLAGLPRSDPKQRLQQMALQLPLQLARAGADAAEVGR
jgi:hypothetical protein